MPTVVQDLYDMVMKPSAGDRYKIMVNEASECIRTQFREKHNGGKEESRIISPQDLISLIRNCENECLEFKSSLLWDYEKKNINLIL
jgi:hypothetical protein